MVNTDMEQYYRNSGHTSGAFDTHPNKWKRQKNAYVFVLVGGKKVGKSIVSCATLGAGF